MDYVKEHVNLSLLKRGSFNIIASGTGTGKTYYIANDFRKEMSHIRPQEILFVASRSLIVEQQAKTEGISKYNPHDVEYINYWNGQEDSTAILERKDIQIMTYDKIIDIIIKKNVVGLETLRNVKVIIFDECHTLFSDASFMKNMEALKVWIRDSLYSLSKIIIGLTATPAILEEYKDEWGVKIIRLNKKILMGYKVKQLHCTNIDTIPYIVTTQLDGKTMIMCYSYKQCLKLRDSIPNSFILTSKYNKNFTAEMNTVRYHIVKNESLPETFIDTDGQERELNVLIVTSTLREGVNLRENSGVRNIVCCFSDELHVTQFVGRARYSIDNLVVADSHINADNMESNSYLAKCRDKFKLFMKNRDNTSWFDSIEHLIEHDVYGAKRFVFNKDENRFITYINQKWLVPKGLTHFEDLKKYKIYKQEDKEEIVKMSMDCGLLKLYPSHITFLKVVNFMKGSLGYIVENKRGLVENERYRYKLVVDFDEDKVKIDKGEKDEK